ncbi:hypothetical protein B566_EDAN007064 [Ephemera danica]|nr:hypothetical protein B566_EDAN007064 [Ephemera danica]
MATLTCTRAQSGACQLNTKHVCVGRDQFRECHVDNQGQMVPADAIFPCTVLNAHAKNFVCYGAAQTPAQVCGPPPPPCTADGNFPIETRCRNFYTCMHSGTQFMQQILECEPGFEFSKREKRCVHVQLAGCSIPHVVTAGLGDDPPPPAPTPSPTSTTSSVPSCTPFTTHPDPTSCHHYYQCFLLGRRVRMTCPFGWLYDTTRKTCVTRTECNGRPII